MKRVLTSVWDNDGQFLMTLVTALTIGTGLILGNPYADTFSTGKGWDILASLHLWGLHPTEDQWGVSLVFLGLFQATTIWQLSGIRQMVDRNIIQDRGDFVAYRVTQIVWGATASLYAGMMMSFLLSNPWGIITLWVGFVGVIASVRVCTRVRQTVEAAGEAERKRGGK